MNRQTGAGNDEGTATGTRQEATATRRAAKSRGEIKMIAIDCPPPPEVKVSAKAMANYLESYAKQMLYAAEQLRAKPEHETMTISWPPCGVVMNCNGGGDG